MALQLEPTFALPEEYRPKFQEISSKPLPRLVAMPSETMWNNGYRPAWMLSETRNPPEKYSDARKMYQIYLKTGKVVYPHTPTKVDSVKARATAYRNKNYTKKNHTK